MASQLYEAGDVLQAGVNELECVGVSYQEVDGEKANFTYSFKLKSEMDAEREAAAQAEAEAQAAAEAAEAEQAAPAEEGTK